MVSLNQGLQLREIGRKLHSVGGCIGKERIAACCPLLTFRGEYGGKDIHDHLIFSVIALHVLIYGHLEGRIGIDPILPFRLSEERKHYSIDAIGFNEKFTHVSSPSYHCSLSSQEVLIYRSGSPGAVAFCGICILYNLFQLLEDRKPKLLVKDNLFSRLLAFILLPPESAIKGSEPGHGPALKHS